MLTVLRNWWLRLRYPPLPETRRCVARFDAPDGKRYVEFLERDDRMFVFEKSSLQRNQEYEFWAPTHCSGLYASLEAARLDAQRELPWLRNEG